MGAIVHKVQIAPVEIVQLIHARLHPVNIALRQPIALAGTASTMFAPKFLMEIALILFHALSDILVRVRGPLYV